MPGRTGGAAPGDSAGSVRPPPVADGAAATLDLVRFAGPVLTLLAGALMPGALGADPPRPRGHDYYVAEVGARPGEGGTHEVLIRVVNHGPDAGPEVAVRWTLDGFDAEGLFTPVTRSLGPLEAGADARASAKLDLGRLAPEELEGVARVTGTFSLAGRDLEPANDSSVWDVALPETAARATVECRRAKVRHQHPDPAKGIPGKVLIELQAVTFGAVPWVVDYEIVVEEGGRKLASGSLAEPAGERGWEAQAVWIPEPGDCGRSFRTRLRLTARKRGEGGGVEIGRLEQKLPVHVPSKFCAGPPASR